MKRKSTLILIAALVLAVSIPVFAMAETAAGVQPLDGAGNMYGQRNAQTSVQGSRLMLTDCDEDCDCEAQGAGLGNDGVVQRRNARTASGQQMLLKNSNSASCEDCENCDSTQPEYKNRRDLNDGFRGRRQSI